MNKDAARALVGLSLLGTVSYLAWRSRNAAGSAPADNAGEPWSLVNWIASAGGLLSGYVWTTPAAGVRFDPWFAAAEARYGLPGGILSRMAYQETGGTYRDDLVSPKRATGLMQLMPIHWSQVNPLDTAASIDYAGKLLLSLYNRFGDWSKALAAYNWGQGNLQKLIATADDGWLSKLPRETYNYVTQIGADIGVAGFQSSEQVA